MENQHTIRDTFGLTVAEVPVGQPVINEAGESDEIERSVDISKSEDSNMEGDSNEIRGFSKSIREQLHPGIAQFVEALGDKLSRENGEFRKHRESSILITNDKHRKLLTDYTLAMLNFIPATILQQLCTDDHLEASECSPPRHQDALSLQKNSTVSTKDGLQLPLCYRSKSLVLVAEITNFYDQTKASEFSDKNGFNEHMATVSGQFLEISSSILNKYGGDLIQFLGHSLVAIWPPDPKEEQNSNESHIDYV